MKNYLTIFFAALIISSCATKSSFHSFYKENKKETAFSISSPAFFANMFIPREDVKDYEELFKKVRHYKVMIFSDSSSSIDKKFNNFIKAKNYTSIIRINEDRDKIQCYFLKKGAVIKEMILKVKNENEYVLLGLKTNISENDLNTMVENSDIEVAVH